MTEEGSDSFSDIIQRLKTLKAPEEKSLFDILEPKPEAAPPAEPPAPTPQAVPSRPAATETPALASVGAAEAAELREQIEQLAAKLAETQEKALSATIRLQEREAAQRELEELFKSVRAESRLVQAQEAEKQLAAKMQARIDSLEARLDDRWEAPVVRASHDSKLRSAQGELEGLARQMERLHENLRALERKVREALEVRLSAVEGSASEMLRLLPDLKVLLIKEKAKRSA